MYYVEATRSIIALSDDLLEYLISLMRGVLRNHHNKSLRYSLAHFIEYLVFLSLRRAGYDVEWVNGGGERYRKYDLIIRWSNNEYRIDVHYHSPDRVYFDAAARKYVFRYEDLRMRVSKRNHLLHFIATAVRGSRGVRGVRVLGVPGSVLERYVLREGDDSDSKTRNIFVDKKFVRHARVVIDIFFDKKIIVVYDAVLGKLLTSYKDVND